MLQLCLVSAKSASFIHQAWRSSYAHIQGFKFAFEFDLGKSMKMKFILNK